MNELFKKNQNLFTTLALALVMFTLLSLRVYRPNVNQMLSGAVELVVSPFQKGYHKAAGSYEETVESYVNLVELKEENARLKMQLETLQEELSHHINASIQFNLLRDQLKFMEEPPQPKVFAEVIGESVDNFHHVLLINKGENAGIKRNFPVVLREGVVGRIQSVTSEQSVVQLIVDRRHRFPVLVQRSRERLTLQGNEETLNLTAEDRGLVVGLGNNLEVSRIRMLSDVQKGDRVITSGLDGIFPKGMLVGTITEVRQEKHELFQRATVQPTVNFNRLEGVFVILKRPGSQFPLFSSP